MLEIELTNHYVEGIVTCCVERIEENTYGSKKYFRFYYGNGKWSKEFSEPTYTYRVL